MDCVVSEPLMKGNKAEFYVEQLMLGQLDSSLRYKPALPDEPDEPIMLRRDQSLVLTTEYSKAGPGTLISHVQLAVLLRSFSFGLGTLPTDF